ncbi:MAG: hypothetical protein ACFFG0_42985, partial [Candidatus Thorarchaeota archaeon]
ETYQLLKKIDKFLFTVEIERVSPEEIDRIVYNRLNLEFKTFIRFCKIFIQHCTIKMQTSKLEFFSFLIPMELLFEHFIGNYLKRKFHRLLPEGIKSIPETQEEIGHLIFTNSHNLFKLQPDISIKEGNKAIIDTKYKILSRSKKKKDKFKISQSDLYQMYAYCKEYGANKCLLLYPEGYTGKFKDINWKLGKSKEIDLYIRTISLTYDFTSDNGKKNFEKEFYKVLSCLG